MSAAGSGLKRFLSQGIRFAQNFAATTYVGIRMTGAPATSFYLNLPTALPGTTQALTVDSTGNMGYLSAGAGTVTSVALTAPSIFTVGGSPITSAGTLSLTLASQAQNLGFFSPDGATGTPTFRAMVANDVPTLLASKISNFDTQVRTSRLDQMALPTASVNLNGQKITGLAEPTLAQDAATKNYVDTAVVGATIYKGVADGSAANPTAATGVGAWSNGWMYRVTTAGSTAFGFQVNVGDFVIYNGTTWNKIDATDPAVTGTTNRITVTPTGDTSYAVDIASTYAGQATITTLGTITTGVWNGTDVAVADGGTGASTAAGARTNLGAAGVFNLAFTNATLSSGILTVTHNLGKQFCDFKIYDATNKWIEPDDVTATSTTVLTVDMTSYIGFTGTFNIVVTG